MPDIFWWFDLSSRRRSREWRRSRIRGIEMLDFDQKADEDLSRHAHCAMGSPSLLKRTKARPKNLCLK